MPQSSPPRSGLPVCLGVVAALAGNLFGQSAVPLSRDTPFFKDPGSVRLGTLVAGTPVSPGSASSGYLPVTIEGWIFTASTRPDQRDGFDLSVRLPEGENFRAAPSGALLGRAVQGALFKRLGAEGGWTRVQRTVWISEAAVRRSAPAGRAGSDTVGRGSPPPAAEPPAARRNPPDPGRSGAEPRATVRPGVELQRNPDGAAVARVLEPVEVAVGEVSGEWVRVRLEGWVRRGEVDSAVTPRPAITGAMLRENPERYVGQTVEWRVQFLALQQADELRPEMALGQSYLLVRGPLPEAGFAYVTVTRAQAEQLAALLPLEELALVVTVRAGRTRYLATPVVELVRRVP